MLPERRLIWKKSIHQGVERDGLIGVFVNLDGINEQDREKLSAYRQLARELGYEVGEFRRTPSGTALMPLRKRPS